MNEEFFTSALPPFPSLCPKCVIALSAAVHHAQIGGKRLDFHWCEHRQVLALIGWINGKVANWSLHSHMTPEDVTRLFRDADAICEHTPVERPIGGDALN